MPIFLEGIPVRETDPRDTPPPPTTTTTTTTTSPEDVALAAARRAAARGSASATRTAQRYGRASADLQAQIKAIKDALKNEFKRGRKQNLRDINPAHVAELGAADKGQLLGRYIGVEAIPDPIGAWFTFTFRRSRNQIQQAVHAFLDTLPSEVP